MRTLISAGVVLALVCSMRLSAQAPAECRDVGDVRYVCGQQAPEDLVVLPGGQWVVASAYAGSGGINLVRVKDRTSVAAYPSATAKGRLDAKAYPACPGPPDASANAKFTTHGLSIVPGRGAIHRLFAVGHGSRESIEVFEIDARRDTPMLTWIGCAIAPEPVGLNSVKGLRDGGFIATNFLARGIDANGRGRMLEGEKNGELWEWHAGTGWQKLPGSEAAGANGIEMSVDGRWLYVAAWGSRSFFRMSHGRTPVERMEIPLGFRVDNIRWARDGSLLAAGQGGAPGMTVSQVVKIDPKTLAVRPLLQRADTPAFGAGTVAVEVGDRLWVGSFRGDRLAIFPTARGS